MGRANGHEQPNGAAPCPARPPQRFAFVLLPNFSMIAFASAVEPLRIANRWPTARSTEWQIVSKDGGLVRASNGCLVTTDQSLAEVSVGPGQTSPRSSCAAGSAPSASATASCSPGCGAPTARARCSARSAPARICSPARACSTATAAPSTGRTCRASWRSSRRSTSRADLFEVDRKRLTCSGGTAALDLMLHLIAATTVRSWRSRSPSNACSTASASRTTTSACPIACAWASIIPS